jgi:hypothetical protein
MRRITPGVRVGWVRGLAMAPWGLVRESKPGVAGAGVGKFWAESGSVQLSAMSNRKERRSSWLAVKCLSTQVVRLK